MNLLNKLGLVRKPATSKRNPIAEMLPLVNSVVDIAAVGSPRREALPVNEIGPDAIVTRRPSGIAAGESADFLYTTPDGRYRFTTQCDRIEGKDAIFRWPQKIKLIESYAARRGARRIAKILPVQWRYAPDGAGYGDFLPGSLMDLSVGGASLVVKRVLKLKTQVEVCFMLKPEDPLVTEICEVVRASKIEKSGMHTAGIRFVSMAKQSERQVNRFLDELQTTRRDRGVV